MRLPLLSDSSFREAPPRTVEELAEPKGRYEAAYRIATARVVFADYDLLQQDFPRLRTAALAERHPELRELSGPARAGRVREVLDGWLLDNGALVSESQAGQTELNTQIAIDGPPRAVYRRPQAGRTLIAPLPHRHATTGRLCDADPLAPEPGLLDLKGVGVGAGVTPQHGPYSDGLLLLAQAFEEYLNQCLVMAAFRHAEAPHGAVPVYAILDTGFYFFHSNGTRHSAGILVRRASRRKQWGWELPLPGSAEQALHLQAELLLRRYGLSSSTHTTDWEFLEDEDGRLRCRHSEAWYDGCTEERLRRFCLGHRMALPASFEGVNVQSTRERADGRLELVDFGQYNARERFEHPLLSRVRQRPFEWGGVIPPSSPGYVQPDPRLAVSPREWASGRDEVSAHRYDPAHPNGTRLRLEDFGYWLARDFHERQITGLELLAALQARVRRTIARWPPLGTPPGR